MDARDKREADRSRGWRSRQTDRDRDRERKREREKGRVTHGVRRQVMCIVPFRYTVQGTAVEGDDLECVSTVGWRESVCECLGHPNMPRNMSGQV